MTGRDGATAGELAERLSTQGVKYALASFVDIHGVCKGKAVPLAHLADMAAGSELYTGAALDGVPQEVNDDEVATWPDLDRGVVLPWEPSVAWFPSDLRLRGEPFAACSRGALGRVVADAAAMGFQPMMGIETEFLVLRRTDTGALEPAAATDTLAKPCYDIAGLLHNLDIVGDIVDAMNGLGWDVYSFDHEDANGQFETDFGYTDAVGMADRFVFFRLMVAELARRRGLVASFMPKLFGHRTGNGAHLNVSLADGATGANVFVPGPSPDDADPQGCGLSPLGYHFVGGVLRHAGAICALAAPTVNSYKRLVRRGSDSGFTWAPIFACYGANNRTNMLRIPMAGGRVECRAADMSLNPYLAAALLFAAGLEGVREGIDPGEPHRENLYEHTDAELEKLGIAWLPRTLAESVAALAADELAHQVLGDELVGAFVELKAAEWDSYHNHVSDWEIQRYAEMF